MDIKDIAKEIRAILKNTFPATKFSVKCSRFSQGSAVDTSWTDGPTTDEVDTLINMYGNGRSQFVETNRKHSVELINKAIAVWKVQNPEYAHLTVTCEGEVSCHAKFSVSEFKLGVLDLHFYETSLNKIIRGVSEFDLSALYLKMHRQPKAVSVSELAPQPELEPSQPELVEVLTETAPNNQVSELEAELLNVQELLKHTRKLADTLESEAYRLTIQITAANLAQLANKAEIKQIILTRDEGTIAESGTTVTTDGWLEAERILKQWSTTVISLTRADKCRIVFEFADGESFKLSSFELMQKHRFGVNLAKKLLAELQYMAGEIIPAHMTRQDYENFCKFCKINPDVYKRLLNNWAIPA